MTKKLMAISPGRYISRNVVIDGRHVGLMIVEIKEDGTVVTEPFSNETAFTIWTDQAIEIDTITKPTSVVFKSSTIKHTI